MTYYKQPFILKNYLFIYFYFWLCWVFVAACGLSLAAASGDYSWLLGTDFSWQWLFLLPSTGSSTWVSEVAAYGL